MGRSPWLTTKNAVPDLGTLARLLYLSAGITKRKPYAGGELYFRAAACTGALYHIDLYLVCGDLPGLGAGVYQFGPNDFGLVRLREGDYRGVLADASGHETSIVEAPVTLVLADTHWRNAWKYGARAYRHAFWDAGTLLANTLAATSGAGAPAKVVTSFVDEEVHRLLGLEADKESVVALVPLGRASEATPAAPLPIDALAMPTEPLSSKMVEYPAIYEMHRSSVTGFICGRGGHEGQDTGVAIIRNCGQHGAAAARRRRKGAWSGGDHLAPGFYEDVCSRPDLGRGAVGGSALLDEGDRCRFPVAVRGFGERAIPDSQRSRGSWPRGRTAMIGSSTGLNC